MAQLGTQTLSRVCARIATRDSVHSSRNAGSCAWCVSKLLQVETARHVKASAVHHGTDRHIYLRSSPSRSSRVVRIDVGNGNRLERMTFADNNTLNNGRWCSCMFWRWISPALQDAVIQWRSGWVSGTTSRSAARQWSRITIFRFFWVSWLPLSRNCKIGTSNCH